MFRSLFVRMTLTYFLILLLGLLILGAFFYTFMDNYITNETFDELEREGHILAGYVNGYYGSYYSRKYLNDTCELLCKNQDSVVRVYLTNREPPVELYSYYSSVDYDVIWDTKVEINSMTDEERNDVLAGNIVRRKGVYGEQEKYYMLTVCMPLSENDQVYGILFMHAPLKGVSQTLNEIFRFVLQSAAMSAIVTITIMFFYSRRISRPITQMSLATREIVKGDYTKRVSAKGRDEIAQLAHNFNAMTDHVEQLEELRRSFVANVSHELRSPLTSIRGYIQGVLDGTFGQDQQGKYLGIALDETMRLNRLINDLLDLAQIESGEIPISPSEFNINELVSRAIAGKEAEISEKHISVQIDFETEQCYVSADKDRILQVIINLIDNAIKFNRDHGKISIKTWTHRGEVYVKIEDEGRGLAYDQIMRIWDRFYQADPARSDKKGRGLGLSIVKKIIEEHGQQIWVNSEEGTGSAFIFSLKAVEKKK